MFPQQVITDVLNFMMIAPIKAKNAFDVIPNF